MSGIEVRPVEVRPLDVRPLGRAEAEALMGDIARLRIEVFRAFPYLYDGDAAYERRYLETYLRSAGAVVIGAFDGDALVGAATASPLADHFDAFAGPFAAHGLDPADWFYFGKSVLLPRYRGRGVGVRFFEEREGGRGGRVPPLRVLRRGQAGRPPAAAGRLHPARRILGEARLSADSRPHHRVFLARHRRDRGDGEADGILGEDTRLTAPGRRPIGRSRTSC